MGYEISIDKGHGIARVRLAGAMSHSENLRCRREVLEACLESKIHKILIDARQLSGKPTTIEIFDFAASWAGFWTRPRIMIAGVAPEDPSALEWWKFGESAAANRGVVTRAFSDLDQAHAWLSEA